MNDIVLFSTVHLRDDSRIRSKMMSTLSAAYPGRVSLFVQDGLGDERDQAAGYHVVDTGRKLPRLLRMTLGGWRMFNSIRKARPKIAHFHDPELIPWALALRVCGIRVIYDVHEDYPAAVSENYLLPKALRIALPPIVRFVEWASAPFFNAVVTVTPQIMARFNEQRSVLVRNFPMVQEFHSPAETPMHLRPAEFTYIGTITQNRNIIGMITAINAITNNDAVLRLAGDFPVDADKDAAMAHSGWHKVRYEGWLSRDGIADVLANSRAGLVVLKPIEHEMQTLPIKLFEYMAAGLPVISSNFKVWREIIEKFGCGLVVDPTKPEEISEAMQWILENPELSQAMGERGRQAVLKEFNWEVEAKELLNIYESLIHDDDHH